MLAGNILDYIKFLLYFTAAKSYEELERGLFLAPHSLADFADFVKQNPGILGRTKEDIQRNPWMPRRRDAKESSTQPVISASKLWAIQTKSAAAAACSRWPPPNIGGAHQAFHSNTWDAVTLRKGSHETKITTMPFNKNAWTRQAKIKVESKI